MQKIFITTGGTGGHIIPARCLAKELSEKYKVRILTDKNYKKYHSEDDNFNYSTISSAKATKKPLKLIFFLIKITLGVLKSLFLILIHRPKYVFSFGGYATFPTIIAAILTKRKIILHEQNAHLGKVHRIFAKFATKIALTFKKTDALPSNFSEKTVITGNPVRKEIIELNKKQYQFPQEIQPKKRNKMGYDNILLASEFEDAQEADNQKQFFNILILGGSGGAKIFSEILPKAIFNLGENLKNDLNIFQQCRENLLEQTFEQYENFNINIEIDSFFEDMENKIDKAHLIIARSGSSSIFEFAAAKKPMILIPFAKAADNHQLKNAKIFEKSGCAILVEEKNFTINKFSKTLTNLLQNKEKLATMSENCNKIATLDAAQKLANLID